MAHIIVSILKNVAIVNGVYIIQKLPVKLQKLLRFFGIYLNFLFQNRLDYLKLFDAEFYKNINADIKSTNVDPLLHYLKYGITEKRNPNPWFDATYIHEISNHQDTPVDPLQYYVEQKIYSTINPNPLFDSEWYLGFYGFSGVGRFNPLLHYLNFGFYNGYPKNKISLQLSNGYFNEYGVSCDLICEDSSVSGKSVKDTLVIIPIYNKWAYTQRLLISLLKCDSIQIL